MQNRVWRERKAGMDNGGDVNKNREMFLNMRDEKGKALLVVHQSVEKV
jgi:hypothetical protein